jgi:hypothetical protein
MPQITALKHLLVPWGNKLGNWASRVNEGKGCERTG